MKEVKDCKSRIQIVRESLVYRRSVRAFTNVPIDSAVLDDLITAAKSAPSGSNWQNQRFLVITEPEKIERIGKIRFVWPYKTANFEKIKSLHPAGIIGRGTALILVFADASQNDARGNGEYYIWEVLEAQNCSASIQNILTMATAHGLGSCWVSASEGMRYSRMLSGKTWQDALSEYEIPDYYKIQGLIILGHPKSFDENGYAKGETMHGATQWTSTARKPNEHYLIKSRGPIDTDLPSAPSLTRSERLIVTVYSKSIKRLMRIIRRLDKRIHKIEYGRHLTK